MLVMPWLAMDWHAHTHIYIHMVHKIHGKVLGVDADGVHVHAWTRKAEGSGTCKHAHSTSAHIPAPAASNACTHDEGTRTHELFQASCLTCTHARFCVLTII